MLDKEYLAYFPFLSNSGDLVRQLNITINKIENTNIFNETLGDIYDEISTLLVSEIKTYSIEPIPYEVSKFYITLLLLKGLDNPAVKRIWLRHYKKKIGYNIKRVLEDYKTEHERINIFLDIFRLLETNEYYKLKRITIEGESAFGMDMLTYLDVFDNLVHEQMALHKGYVIIPFNAIELLTTFITKFAEQKINKLYDKADIEVSITRKIKIIVEKLKGEIIKNQKVSINVKKHHVNKELLQEQERVKDVEKANQVIDQLEQLRPFAKQFIEISNFPPCVNILLSKLLVTKEKLSHNENILLCTYLEKKHFDIDQVIKIFSKAANYDPRTTKYQVTFIYKKGMMPSNCQNLGIEGLCKMDLDKTNQCGKIKNPLSYR